MKNHSKHCKAYKGYTCTCPNKPRIVIVMDGGLIQTILGDTVIRGEA